MRSLLPQPSPSAGSVPAFCLFGAVERSSSFGGKPVSKIQHAWGKASIMGFDHQDLGMKLKKIPWSSPAERATCPARYLDL